DDWPYLYLEKPALPREHLAISALILLLMLLLRRFFFAPGDRIEWVFFFLGAAFLLLEVHGINQSMLLFGTTWVVNSYVISAVLLLIFLANLLSTRISMQWLPLVLALLLGSVVLNYVVPLRVFEQLSTVPRAVFSSLFLCLPILFSGIVFVKF